MHQVMAAGSGVTSVGVTWAIPLVPRTSRAAAACKKKKKKKRWHNSQMMPLCDLESEPQTAACTQPAAVLFPPPFLRRCIPAVRISLSNTSRLFLSLSPSLAAHCCCYRTPFSENDRDGDPESSRRQAAERRCHGSRNIDGGGCFWRHLRRERRSQTAEDAGVEEHHIDDPPARRFALRAGSPSIRFGSNSRLEWVFRCTLSQAFRYSGFFFFLVFPPHRPQLERRECADVVWSLLTTVHTAWGGGHACGNNGEWVTLAFLITHIHACEPPDAI